MNSGPFYVCPWWTDVRRLVWIVWVGLAAIALLTFAVHLGGVQ